MGIVTEDQKDPNWGETWSGKRGSGVIWGWPWVATRTSSVLPHTAVPG